MDKLSSNELSRLKEHHKDILKWSETVKNKIHEVETIYLEDTKLGNIIRGWELDGRPVSSHRNRSQHEEKERLFSSSSYQDWLDQKSQTDNNNNNNNEKPVYSS